MHKPESVLKNVMHETVWDFKIQTDHLIPTRRQDLVIIKKKKKKRKKENQPNSGICSPGESQTENQRKWKER